VHAAEDAGAVAEHHYYWEGFAELMNALKHIGTCHVERSRDVGVPRLKSSRVALGVQPERSRRAARPRTDYRAVGFPLQSLTRKSV
jgi:hypothetical protein